jgi:hypothetical protein
MRSGVDILHVHVSTAIIWLVKLHGGGFPHIMLVGLHVPDCVQPLLLHLPADARFPSASWCHLILLHVHSGRHLQARQGNELGQAESRQQSVSQKIVLLQHDASLGHGTSSKHR